MKVSLHLGPHRTATTYIQYAAYQNRAYLADKGIHFINRPAQSNEIPEALIALRPDVALAEFDRLIETSKKEFDAADPAASILYSSEMFFGAELRHAAEFQRGFAQFVANLEGRGHQVELIFVERNLEDVLTSNALLQASLGNLWFVSPVPWPYINYLKVFTWAKSFYFDRFKVVHLGFDHLTGGGDLFANFMKLAYGLDLPQLRPIDPALDARNSPTDAQIARGLVMAPLINWLEQFGSLSRFEMFNASSPLAPPVSGEAWDAIVANVPLLRDFVRSMARKAIEAYPQEAAAAQAPVQPRRAEKVG